MTNRKTSIPRLSDFLGHILEAIERIQEYTLGIDEASFTGSRLVQDAVKLNLQTIGEAARNISVRFPEFASEHPELPLSDAYQMRNALVHGYFAVDFAVVWATIQRDLPQMESGVRIALAEIDGHRGGSPSSF